MTRSETLFAKFYFQFHCKIIFVRYKKKKKIFTQSMYSYFDQI